MSMTDDVNRRSRLVRRIRGRLERRSGPRFQMGVIVAATGCAGFFAAVLLLAVGIEQMWLRYGLAVVAAYLVFLGSVWLWLLAARKRSAPDFDAFDVVDLASADGAPSDSVVGGGNFGGGGADSSFGVADPRVTAEASVGGGGIGFDLSSDELILLLAVLAAVVSALVAAAYLVVTAPTFFAEILLDGVLSVGLYRRLRRIQKRHWFESAIRRTAGPFLAVLMFFVIAGAMMQAYAPEARSIGGVWRHLVESRR